MDQNLRAVAKGVHMSGDICEVIWLIYNGIKHEIGLAGEACGPRAGEHQKRRKALPAGKPEAAPYGLAATQVLVTLG